MSARRGPIHGMLSRPAPTLVIGVLLCCVPSVTLILVVIEQPLLQAGILNTKDLPPIVGQESGTLGDYILNIWHWDGMILLGMLASLPCLFVGVFLLRRWWGSE